MATWCTPSARRRRSHDHRPYLGGALRVLAGGLPGLPDHLEGPATAAHAADGVYERDLGRLGRRLDPDRGPEVGFAADPDPRHDRGGLGDDQRRRRLRHHGPHAEDVQEEGGRQVIGLLASLSEDLFSTGTEPRVAVYRISLFVASLFFLVGLRML